MQGKEILGSQEKYSNERRNMIIHDGAAQRAFNVDRNYQRVQTPFEDFEEKKNNDRCEISVSDQQQSSIEIEPISNQITIQNRTTADHMNPMSFAPSDIEDASDPLKIQVQSEMNFSRNMTDFSHKPQTVQNSKQDYKRESRYDVRIQANDRSFKYARSSSNPVLAPYPGRTPPNNEQ